ncbi:conserved Plasmodium protein, unknown function [Plasmodium ovale]|uniref:Uncharacterized protein n=2 Tax=Plasmodium ovale TaxID=36330 RepID=A0A1A8X3S6_PLAOA|nr:conserved Plasmodium protein, unknown function [Plasmodium ovale curtisi]SBS98413.1 conserved Plasmodium protein, unknown function [Plasmodium ovale curtisi]SCQ17094.1 conserved Plasmodium protein, unknown function [Plasmodium ovale]
MIRRSKVNLLIRLFPNRKLLIGISKDNGYTVDAYGDLNFLTNEIKHNLHKLQCIEQKKIKSDRIIYKKILKDMLNEKENFVADEMVHFLYILVYNDLYYLDICSNFISYFYHNFIFSKRYFNNVNVNSIIHVIYSYYLFENYHFLAAKGSVFGTASSVRKAQERENAPGDESNMAIRGITGSCGSREVLGSGEKNMGSLLFPPLNESREDTGGKCDQDSAHGKGGGCMGMKSRYNEYYSNRAYGSFHMFNHLSPFIFFNVDYINKNHLIKILLVLSQFVHNACVMEISQNLQKRQNMNVPYNEKELKNVETILFTLIEAFVEKINIKKDIKKSYTPETINEKEIKKKKERYINLIDNSYKNFIYIDNDLNDHKLICLFFHVLSNIFYPTSTNLCSQKGGNILIEELSKMCSLYKTTEGVKLYGTYEGPLPEYVRETPDEHPKIDITNFSVVNMFRRHYNKMEIRKTFYKNTDSGNTHAENFLIYKNNILKNVKKYIFMENIYNLDTHYKLIFFRAIYSLNFFHFPYLKYIHLIHFYHQNGRIDNFDYCDNLHFRSDQSVHIEIMRGPEHERSNQEAQLGRTKWIDRLRKAHSLGETKGDKQKNHRSGQRRTIMALEQWLKNKLSELSKRGDIFNNVYLNLLNDIEQSIKNNSPEQTVNTLLHLHLLRFIDNHFVILLISKLCNSTDKLKNEHKKKIDVIITSLLTFLPAHIHSIGQSSPKQGPNTVIFNHIYYSNSIYVKHLKKLHDFLLLLHNKKIFKRKRKELLSWANYKCV